MPQTLPMLVRPAKKNDLPALGKLGAALALAHHKWDAKRFFVVPDMAEGYAWWLGRELKNEDAIVLVAERGGKVVGYVYGRMQERDWNALLDACGVVIDLILAPTSRGKGAGKLLLDALLAEFTKRGAPRVVLQTAARNEKAQAFFAAQGFRPTMIEMTRETKPRRATKTKR